MNLSLAAFVFLVAAFLGLTNVAVANLPKANFDNVEAPFPKFDIWNSSRVTQITYTNGSERRPELFIMVCDKRTKHMEFQFYITRNDAQILSADYFTIQQYPVDWTEMNYPYLPPARVIYDGGMGLNRTMFSSTLESIFMDKQESSIVFTFEEVTEEYGAITKAWSEIIPSYIFKRDFANKDITGCVETESRTLIPLIMRLP